MAKILSFPDTPEEPEEAVEVIWACGNCSCTSFHIHDTGDIECVMCGDFQDGEVAYVVPRKDVIRLPEDFVWGDDYEE